MRAPTTSTSVQAMLIAGALTSSLLVACARQQAPAAAPTPTPVPAAAVTAQNASRGDIQQTLSYSGDIRAREQVSVLPKVSGRVDSVMVDVGSHVKAGDALAVLEQDSAEITALQARASLAAGSSPGAGPYRFRVPSGLTSTTLSIRGTTAPPFVTLTGPGGRAARAGSPDSRAAGPRAPAPRGTGRRFSRPSWLVAAGGR